MALRWQPVMLSVVWWLEMMMMMMTTTTAATTTATIIKIQNELAANFSEDLKQHSSSFFDVDVGVDPNKSTWVDSGT